MIKYPYGMADFKSIIKEGYFYCDKTDKIHQLENSKSQVFIRPRRFGKSLVLSMLENYYDVAEKDEFEQIFGNLKIGREPTQLRNSYYILKFDFSCVDPTGTAQDIKQSLFNHINSCIEHFNAFYRYKGYDLPKIKINYDDALVSLRSLASSVSMTPYPVYLLIDEYDNFANTVMMGIQSREDNYKAIVHDEGPLRTFFKTIKSLTSSSMFDRVFITGVSPVVMSDITSGYNIAENIYFEPEFNDLCGFKQKEIEDAIKNIIKECKFEKKKIKQAVDLIRTYYNGYRFSKTKKEYIYNPTLCLYFFKQFQKSCSYPDKMLDSNLAMDESKLEYIAQIPGGTDILMNLTQTNQILISDIKDRFGIKEMLEDWSKDNSFLVSFLYYFGVVTISGTTKDLKTILKVPNLVIKSLYVERLQKFFLPEPMVRDEGKRAADQVYTKGDILPLCKFMEKKYFKVFSSRDYRWANELTLKTAFLTLLYNDLIFIMDSELELEQRYADLTMIIRPDKRHGKVFDVLIEFKFIKLTDIKINKQKISKLSMDELMNISQVKSNFQKGKAQVKDYAAKLEKKYKDLRLQKFVVVSLGFERVCFKKI